MMVAGGACGDQVLPTVITPQMARDHVVNRQVSPLLAAVLASVVISPEDLSFIQLHGGVWTFDHHPQADDRGAGIHARDRLDDAAPIEH